MSESGGDGSDGAPVAVLGGRGEIGKRALQRPAHVLRLPGLRPRDPKASLDQSPEHLATIDVLLDTTARARLRSSEYALHRGHRLDPT